VRCRDDEKNMKLIDLNVMKFSQFSSFQNCCTLKFYENVEIYVHFIVCVVVMKGQNNTKLFPQQQKYKNV
jgi:hypothetical protein